MYEIFQDILPELPKLVFRKGIGKFEGVVMHDTANDNSTIDEEVRFMKRNYQNAFVHFYCGATKIVQTADTDYLAYGAGKTANLRYLHIELCHAKTENEFQESYNRWIYIAALYLHQNKLGVIDGETLLSHYQVSEHFGESDHTDPIAYLERFGKTWDNVVNDVTFLYNELDRWESEKDHEEDWKEKGKTYLAEQGYIDGTLWKATDPVDIGTLGTIIKRITEGL
jgi:hypothetical protein